MVLPLMALGIFLVFTLALPVAAIYYSFEWARKQDWTD